MLCVFVDCVLFYAVSAIYQPFNDGVIRFEIMWICNFLAFVKRGHDNFSPKLFFLIKLNCELKERV